MTLVVDRVIIIVEMMIVPKAPAYPAIWDASVPRALPQVCRQVLAAQLHHDALSGLHFAVPMHLNQVLVVPMGCVKPVTNI